MIFLLFDLPLDPLEKPITYFRTVFRYSFEDDLYWKTKKNRDNMANKKNNCSTCLLRSKSSKTKREEKKEYWRTRSKTIKQEILWIKTKLTRVPDNKETAVLMLGENRANTAIQAIHSICWSDDGETKEKNQLQW